MSLLRGRWEAENRDQVQPFTGGQLMPFPRVETGWAAALVALCASSKEEELLQPGKPEGT